ncbi:MAG TPA: tail fiber domain-containing protein, partial [Limnobacter sp.]|uniref:tail fiber domain-containing protein n=1 Tax=Limnobacter sp. TaxID=2003368 RepID=UPI002E313FF4
YDTAIGVSALQQTTGGFNSALGAYAMFSNTTGENNVAVGTQALYSNTTGYHNTAVGDLALYTNTGGYYNTAVGRYALYSAQNGWWNTGLGEGALGNLTVGYDNNGVGVRSLYGTTSGIGNNALGVNAGATNVGGSFNVLVGDYSDVGSASLSHAAAFGAFARVSSSNTVVIGALSTNKTDGAADDQIVIGDVVRDDSYASTKLYVNGTTKINGALYATSVTQTSDRRLKTNIQSQDTDFVLERLAHLSTYTYDYINHPDLGRKIGVIAQEVKPYFPEAVVTSRNGFYSVDYNALGAMAAVGVGRLNVKYNQLNTELQKQDGRINTLQIQVDAQDTRIGDLEQWKTGTVRRLDDMQTAIETNVADIAAHALKIADNTGRITRLEQVTTALDKQVVQNAQGLAEVKGVWNDTFEKQDDGQTLALKLPNLKVSNFSAQQVKANALYTQRLDAEVGKIKALQVDDLYARNASALTVHAEELNTGSTDTYAGVGNPAFLFAAKADGHYTVNTSSPDGSYATATVIVYGGVAKVVPVAQQGIELFAVGNQIKANAAGKAIKASWLKMG